MPWGDSPFCGSLIIWHTFLSQEKGCCFKSFWNIPKQYIWSLSVFVLKFLKIPLSRNGVFFWQLCVQTTVYWAWVWSMYSEQKHSATTAFTNEELVDVSLSPDWHLNESVCYMGLFSRCFTAITISQRLLPCNSLVFLEDDWYPVSSHINFCSLLLHVWGTTCCEPQQNLLIPDFGPIDPF